MRKIQWDNFKSDGEILEYLKRLPRYKNTMIKSAFRRGLFFLNLLYCRLLKLNKPLFVVLVTNNKCNLDCTYCYGNYGERKEYEDYSTRQLLKIIDELKIMGTRLLTVHGGESLLRKDIGEILNYIKKKGFYVGFNTNGYLVPSKIEDLKCVDTVCVSLDGKKANNDINRGKGCFDKVMKAMDVIRQNKIPLVVSATLTKENINDMEFLAELGSKKGCRIQYSILYNYSNIQKRLSNIALDDKEIRETTRKIRELRRNGYPIYYSDNVLTATIDWPISHEKSYLTKEGDELAIKKFKFVPCYHGKFKFQIDADGRVITCWARDDPNAPNIKTLGVATAIKQCHDNNDCLFCAFLANNEHNALMHLSPRNIWNIIRIHVGDSFKIN